MLVPFQQASAMKRHPQAVGNPRSAPAFQSLETYMVTIVRNDIAVFMKTSFLELEDSDGQTST